MQEKIERSEKLSMRSDMENFERLSSAGGS
jgi:hypothetical protein